MMEVIETKFLGVFLLLDKNNYVEIVLSQMEKKYDNVSYKQLQEIRINSISRYKHNNTKMGLYLPIMYWMKQWRT